METTQPSDQETYRAIVLAPGGDELLLVPAGGGFLLPSIEIPRWQRVAESMTLAIRNEWDQEAICLFSLDVSGPVAPANDCKYQVMECPGAAKPHRGAVWVRVKSSSQPTFADPADQFAVQQSLAECGRPESSATLGPFARPGWFRESQRWIGQVIGRLGFHLTGSFSQLNASPSFSLVRFETSGPAVWFKAVGKPNLREFPITLELTKLFPQYLPPILAARPEWHGWLAREVKGTSLGETQDAQLWAVGASTLAKLQIESIGKVGTLFRLGARDLRASSLLQLVRPFLDSMGQLMEKQTMVPPPVMSRSELVLLGEQIEKAIRENADLGIPDALGHLDPNPGNVIVSDCECVFLDWAEAYVGNPLFSFQYLVEHSRRMAGVDSAEGLTGAYSEEWRPLVSAENLQEALVLTPMLAVFAYAAASDGWDDRARLQDPKVGGSLRSLTRRMHREGNRLRNRSAVCPN